MHWKCIINICIKIVKKSYNFNINYTMIGSNTLIKNKGYKNNTKNSLK